MGRLKQDTNFIKQLVDLYKELKTANMTVLNLTELHSAEKQEDLVKIFLAVNVYFACQISMIIRARLLILQSRLRQDIWMPRLKM